LDVAEIARALLGVGIGIGAEMDQPARLALEMYRELAKGTPIEPEAFDRITSASGIPAELARVAAARWLEFDSSGSLTGFGGLTLRPTKHRLLLDGRPFYVWCALDGFLVAHALGLPVAIETSCPGTTTPIRVAASVDAIERVEPSSAVMSVVLPDAATACSVSDTREGFCDFVNFYESETIARDTMKGRGGAVLTMDSAFSLAGELMTPVRRARG
jgi:alkylmercury lyase